MPSLLAGRQQGIRVICNHIPLIPPQLRKAARRACHQGMQSLATKRRHGNAIPKMKRRSTRRRSSKKKKKERRRSKRKKKEEEEKEKEKKKKRERVRPNLEDSKDAAPPSLLSISLSLHSPPHDPLTLCLCLWFFLFHIASSPCSHPPLSQHGVPRSVNRED